MERKQRPDKFREKNTKSLEGDREIDHVSLLAVLDLASVTFHERLIDRSNGKSSEIELGLLPIILLKQSLVGGHWFERPNSWTYLKTFGKVCWYNAKNHPLL